MTQPDWLSSIPALQSLDQQIVDGLLSAAAPVSVPQGAVVFREGDVCNNFLLVLDGAVRVQKLSESGREIVLYRVESGQTCVLTTSCLLAGERYTAEAIAETEISAMAFPHTAFHQLVAESREFREFVFSSYSDRITGLVMLIDAVAFGRMDGRLAAQLSEMANEEVELEITHQDLARELGTAREVVSRLLKDFERRGWLKLGRGKIQVIDRSSLLELAEKVYG